MACKELLLSFSSNSYKILNPFFLCNFNDGILDKSIQLYIEKPLYSSIICSINLLAIFLQIVI